jgi:hypothetical protein
MAGLHSYVRTILPGRRSPIGARGTTIVLREATGNVNVIARSNKVGSQSGEAYNLVLRRGEKWFTATEFDAVEVENPSASETLEVELLIGYGDYVVPAPVLGVSDFVDGHTPIDLAPTATTLLAAENLRRWRVIIQADEDNTHNIIIAGTDTDAAGGNGLILVPGASMTFETRGEIWGSTYGQVTTVADVYVLEENFNA